MLFYIIQTNFVNFTIILFLYIFLLTNRTLDKWTTRLFLFAGIVVNILIIADSLDYYFESLYQLVIYRYVTSATGYALRPCVIVAVLFNLKQYKKKYLAYLIVPFILNFLVAYTSIFTKWMFYFDENNQFHRGICGWIPFVLSGYYLLILTFRAMQKYRIGDKKESAVIFLVAIMAVVAVGMESLFHFKFIINGVGAVSIVFYYLFLHTQTFKRDALTNAFNRHTFYSDKERLLGAPMMIVSIDMNNLKQINDVMGHDEGDKAILAVVRGLTSHLKKNFLLYRMGGDEFTILCPKTREPEVADMMEKAVKDINADGYSIAWGMAYYQPDMDFDKVYLASDTQMYKNKKQMKENRI